MNKSGLNFFLDSQSDTAAVSRIHSSPFFFLPSCSEDQPPLLARLVLLWINNGSK